MTAIHVTLIASAAVNVLALWGWWNTIRALANVDDNASAALLSASAHADRMTKLLGAAQDAHLETMRELNRLRLEWPRRDPVTGRYTKKG